jgi:hypothetical protein
MGGNELRIREYANYERTNAANERAGTNYEFCEYANYERANTAN